jgi:hypothetical protein
MKTTASSLQGERLRASAQAVHPGSQIFTGQIKRAVAARQPSGGRFGG